MEITKDTVIGDIVAKDYRAATVLGNQGIDFCCNGNRSIEEVCKADNLDTDTLIDEIKETLKTKESSSIDYTAWPLDLLADYIEKTHHRYVSAKLVEIMPYLEKIVRVHGGRHPELEEVLREFTISAQEFSKHMKKEEILYFPLVRKMVASHNAGTAFVEGPKPAKELIESMMHEHDEEGERYRRISKMTNGYTVPADGCNTYRVTLGMLKEFQDDLHLHIHLENNILFPKSLELESKLNKA